MCEVQFSENMKQPKALESQPQMTSEMPQVGEEEEESKDDEGDGEEEEEEEEEEEK